MCGIVACVALDSEGTVPALGPGMAALAHRGPDGRNSWTSPDGRVALGHTRLSIIDLETGTQPLANEARSMWAIVNGEFYDFERIRHELEEAGHTFKTKSDSEILLHLYEDRGASALHWLNGEYAFVLWDHHNRELLAARDRFGIKAAVLRRGRRQVVPGVGGQGAVRARRALGEIYFFFRYGRPVLLLTPTVYPVGKSQVVPLFGDLLLKK